MADSELGRTERYGGRNCMIMAYGVRIAGALCGVAACTLSVFGFLDLTRGAPSSLPNSDPAYMGLTLFYLFVIGLLIFVSELRMELLKNTVLKPFGFMHTFIGRGLFYLFVGSLVLSSVQPQGRPLNGGALALGIGMVVVGALEIIFSIFLQKRRPSPSKPYETVQAGADASAAASVTAVAAAAAASPSSSSAFGPGGDDAESPVPPKSRSGFGFGFSRGTTGGGSASAVAGGSKDGGGSKPPPAGAMASSTTVAENPFLNMA